MVNNLPVKSLTHKDITIEGYSRAAVQTYWRIPEFKLGFDLGAQPWSFMGTPTWFVSHTHMDHIVNLPVYIARRRMMKMEPPVIYLPEAAIETVEKILKLFSKLDRGRLPCDLRPCRPGDEIELSRELVVTVSATVHTVPSLGFVVWQRRRKLKPEYQGLAGDAIRDLRMSGTDVTAEVRVPRVAYLGDSSPAGLDACEAMYQAEVLIMEMTFVAPRHRKDKIHKFGHMHLDDVLERRDRFKNERILATHFSTRYHTNQVRDEDFDRAAGRDAKNDARATQKTTQQPTGDSSKPWQETTQAHTEYGFMLDYSTLCNNNPNGLASRVGTEQTADSAEKPGFATSRDADSDAFPSSSAPDDPILAEIIASWPILSIATRKVLQSIVKAAQSP